MDEEWLGDGALVVRTPADGWVELTAPSRKEHLDRVSLFLDVLARTRLSPEAREDIGLVVDEMIANACEWGNRGDARRRIRVSYGIFADEVVVKVEDEGDGFRPDEVPDPTGAPAEVVRQRRQAGKRLGGFGLHVARKLMDRVFFNERGNVVMLAKAVSSTGNASAGTGPQAQAGGGPPWPSTR